MRNLSEMSNWSLHQEHANNTREIAHREGKLAKASERLAAAHKRRAMAVHPITQKFFESRVERHTSTVLFDLDYLGQLEDRNAGVYGELLGRRVEGVILAAADRQAADHVDDKMAKPLIEADRVLTPVDVLPAFAGDVALATELTVDAEQA